MDRKQLIEDAHAAFTEAWEAKDAELRRRGQLGDATAHQRSRAGIEAALAVFEGATHRGSVFNVRDFGAMGDGVHDDTAAFQAAIDAAAKSLERQRLINKAPIEIVKVTLAVIDETHTPSDDEREALARELFVADETDKLSVEECAPLAERVYDLGFRRTVRGEPTPDGWFPFGAHAPYPWIGRLEFSAEKDEVGMPLWERPVQGEPSDAQVARYLYDHGYYVPEGLRDALRVAAEPGGER